MSADLLPLESITQRISVLRGQKVLLDSDLATLYGVPTKRFNEQVKRNLERFPSDFMFQVSEEEFAALRSHFATSNAQQAGRGGRRYLPFAFTEHGAIMAATILNSPRATQISVIAGVLHMHDAKRWTQAPAPVAKAKTQATKR